MKIINNQEIAKLLSTFIYKSHNDNDEGYAAQLFVERVVLPDEVNSYSKEEIECHILEYLNINSVK